MAKSSRRLEDEVRQLPGRQQSEAQRAERVNRSDRSKGPDERDGRIRVEGWNGGKR